MRDEEVRFVKEAVSWKRF